MQLETLTEFVEHHLYGSESRCSLTVVDTTRNNGNSVEMVKMPDLERIDMLVDVCLRLPQGRIMRDWSTIIALLLKESDELISSALRPTLSSILLRIFVSSAMTLKEWYQITVLNQTEEIDEMKGGKQRKSFSKKLNDIDQDKSEEWESLNEHLLQSLPTLLKRFSDDKNNLSVLVRVLTCCNISLSNKALKGLLKSISDFFDSCSDDDVIDSLCKALREWTLGGGSAKGKLGFLMIEGIFIIYFIIIYFIIILSYFIILSFYHFIILSFYHSIIYHFIIHFSYYYYFFNLTLIFRHRYFFNIDPFFFLIHVISIFVYVSIGSVDACVTSLLSGLWTKIENGIQILKGSSVTLSSLAAELKLEGKKHNSKKQKKTVSDEHVEIEDALYTIKVSIMKYKKLWSMLDCRKLVEQDHNDITDYLIEISDIVISLCDDQRYYGELEKICGFIAVDSIYIIQSILAWATNEIYLKSKIQI